MRRTRAPFVSVTNALKIRSAVSTLSNEQRSRDAAAKKRANTSGIGKSNNYYEDIYNNYIDTLIINI